MHHTSKSKNKINFFEYYHWHYNLCMLIIYVCIVVGCCFYSVWMKVSFMCLIHWERSGIFGWQHLHERKSYLILISRSELHKRCGLYCNLFLLYRAYKLYVAQGGRKNNKKEFLWCHTDVQVVLVNLYDFLSWHESFW